MYGRRHVLYFDGEGEVLSLFNEAFWGVVWES